ncbi:hypothetical protein H1164_09165 [Thermoactinomyces daqus]|uniref:DNA helicase n=2 Tax=Thermoactinomyces TaxID=2023 RepID=A0A7W1XAN4_9BACL|nr:AAA domain-containing protein [Thermoactinomyces daqus]MBA4543069.1 hypothetical protein [Thermoactinomyces daqus]
MGKEQDVLRYYFRCFRDDGLSSKLGEGVNLSYQEMERGIVSEEFLRRLLKSGKLEEGEIEYHVCPVVLMHEKDKFQTVAPLYIPACIKDGRFFPIPHRPPYISREYLSPSSEDKVAVGSVEKMDRYVMKHPYMAQDHWEEAWHYAEEMFRAVTGSTMRTFAIKGYARSETGRVIPLPEKPQGSAIESAYQELLSQDRLPVLLKEYLSLEDREKVPLLSAEAGADKHLGQMNGVFPLSDGQRESLHHLFSIENGEILAVNGPPGTGKTTLIQNVVASLWVEAALQEKEPPIIVAASTNNQAVTNILESFAKEGMLSESHSSEWMEKIKKLRGRWLPDVKSYGIYFPSSDKAKKLQEKGHDYQIVRFNGENFMEGLEERRKFHELKNKFIERYQQFAKRSAHSIKEIRAHLHEELKKTHQAILDGMELARKLEDGRKQLHAEFEGSLETLQKREQEWKEQLEEKDRLLDQTEALKQSWRAFRRKEPLIWKILSLFTSVEEKREGRNREFIAQWREKAPFVFSSFSTSSIEQSIVHYHDEVRKDWEETSACLQKAKALLHTLNEGKKEFNRWLVAFGRTGTDDLPDLGSVLRELDRTLRYEAFLLATHYWEARWLEEVEGLPRLEQIREKRPTPKERRIELYHRYAKLAPCFVSTLHMLPQIMSVWQKDPLAYEKNKGKTEYLFEVIDLLIIDEAGQVAPQIAAPSFALARKALVVGDTLQIEPVVSLPSAVDVGNLLGFKVMKDLSQLEEMEAKGITAAKGNVMKIAQRRSKYQKNELAGGMFLAEHRRCVPEIIGFCNSLAYDNNLIAARPNEHKYDFLPHMGYADIEGQAEADGTSKFNVMEAEAIASWLKRNKEKILDRSNRKAGSKRELGEIVGIVTPFRYQSTLIKAFLSECGIEGITVGTLHALQGAERDIILFSAVDTSAKGNAFYDRKPNMLNVAVSRAKDSFIVFANWKKFGRVNHLPSGKLRSFIPEENKVYEQKDEKPVEQLLRQMANRNSHRSEKWNKGEHKIIQQIIHIHENRGQVIINKDQSKVEVVQNQSGS